MVTKKGEPARPVLRRKPKKRAVKKPKRHPWTREDGEIHGLGFKVGYARVSTLDQNLALQQDALREAGCGTYISSKCPARSKIVPLCARRFSYARRSARMSRLRRRTNCRGASCRQ